MSGADRARSDEAQLGSEVLEEPGPGRPTRIRARDLFLLLFCFFALLTSGRVYSPDGVVMGRVTESLVKGQGGRVAPFWIPGGFLSAGRDGALYAKYAPGLSVAALPFYATGAILDQVAPSSAVDAFGGHRILWYPERNPHDAWGFFGMALTNSAVVALIAALLFLLALRMGWGSRAALLVALTAALASPLWPYAKSFFSEPLGGLGLVGFVLFAEAGIRERRARSCFFAGLALGASVLARYADGVFLPLGGLVFLALALRRAPAALMEEGGVPRRAPSVSAGEDGPAASASHGSSGGTDGGPGSASRRERLRWIAAFALGAALVLLAMAGYNLARFGSAWTTGYERELEQSSRGLGEALRGLLVSPGRGFFVYFPAAILALLCLPSIRRRARAGVSWTWPYWTAFSWAALVALVIFYSQWHEWEGGWCWGPRFLVPAVPLLCLQLAPFFRETPADAGRGSHLARPVAIAGGILLALSFLIALSGTMVSYTDYHHALREQFGRDRYYEIALWDWSAFPPFTWWGFTPKSFFVADALRTPSLWWLAALFGALGVFTLHCVRRMFARGAFARAAKVSASRGRVAWLAAGVIVAGACALGAWSPGPRVLLHFDFEQPVYGREWSSAGDAFGSGPSQGAREGRPVVQGWFGRRLANSDAADPARATGTLHSPEFLIGGPWASFEIGGARDPGRVYARLLIDGEERLRATGSGGVALTRIGWDLSGFRGRRARLELVDQSSEEGGFLLFDDFRVYTSRPAER